MTEKTERSYEYDVTLNLLRAIFSIKQSSKVFFLASPSWGKTSLMMKIFEEKVFKKILYISPLTAINIEFLKKLQSCAIPSKIFETRNPHDSFTDVLSTGIYLTTPEKIVYSQGLEEIESWADVIIVDEIHLFLLWQNFRPGLCECWMWLSYSCKNVILLSGTFSWNAWLETSEGQVWVQNAEACYKLDLHGQKLLCTPKKEWLIASRWRLVLITILKFILIYAKNLKILIFFPKRDHVHKWERWCRKYKVDHLSCLGGGASEFMEKLKEHPLPQLILGTSVLSHGVNLPQRNLIIILGNTWEKEIWKQMKSRGGRNGETYYFVSEKQSWMV